MSPTPPLLRIGTRGSPLAVAQANEIKRRLGEAYAELAAPDAISITVIRTTGDATLGSLSNVGGKGLFTKEIEEALIAGSIDLAVHSMKDMPTWLPEGLEIVAMPPREDPRDVLLVDKNRSGVAHVGGLPEGAVVGTSALRREAQLRFYRPDLRIVPFRGNVGTRMKKLEAGEVDATLLALAGLNRLSIADAGAVLSTEEILPAVAQGAIGIEIRSSDETTRRFVTAIDHDETHACVRAERAMLTVLDGSCRTPIGGLATLKHDHMSLEGLVARPDGSELHRVALIGGRDEPERLGREVGALLKGRTGPGFFDGGA